MTTPPASGLSAIIANVNSLVTAAIGWVGDYVDAITGNPLILMFVIVAFVGLGVGLIRRLIRL